MLKQERLICDFEGNVINNVYNTTAGYKLQTIELAVFPLETTSVIIGFTDCRNKRYDGFIQQLQALPLDEQLSALNYIIFCYSENVFVSKILKNTVLKNRKFLNACQKSSIAVSLDVNCDPLATAIEEFDLSKRNEIPNLLSKQYAL